VHVGPETDVIMHVINFGDKLPSKPAPRKKKKKK